VDRAKQDLEKNVSQKKGERDRQKKKGGRKKGGKGNELETQSTIHSLQQKKKGRGNNKNLSYKAPDNREGTIAETRRLRGRGAGNAGMRLFGQELGKGSIGRRAVEKNPIFLIGPRAIRGSSRGGGKKKEKGRASEKKAALKSVKRAGATKKFSYSDGRQMLDAQT